MSENNTNRPTHYVYHIARELQGKDRWTRLGAGWSHRDGEGFTLRLDALPLTGELVIRMPKADEAA
jgi:hypothetical protein